MDGIHEADYFGGGMRKEGSRVMRGGFSGIPCDFQKNLQKA